MTTETFAAESTVTVAALPVAPLSTVEKLKAFALAGKARFTVRSTKTGTRFTFKVSKKGEGPHFVSLLSGSDNMGDYTYLGTVFPDGSYRHAASSRVATTAKSAVAFSWIWRHVEAGKELPEGVQVWHEGRCGRCGRVLTTPESIERGLGPECMKRHH